MSKFQISSPNTILLYFNTFQYCVVFPPTSTCAALSRVSDSRHGSEYVLIPRPMALILQPKSASNHSRPPFLTVPIEIRTAIYALVLGGPEIWNRELHLSCHNNVFQLSPCLGMDENRMNSRTDSGEIPDDTYPHGYGEVRVAARRLRSTWGPHWRCEEHMLASFERAASDGIPGLFGLFLPIFLVCRQM